MPQGIEQCVEVSKLSTTTEFWFVQLEMAEIVAEVVPVHPVENDNLDKSDIKQVDVGFELPKDVKDFRNYVDSEFQESVSSHYRLMRTNQSMEYVTRMQQKYSFADGKFRAKLTFREVFKLLDNYVDSSDPDIGLPNFIHNFQTAEGIRGDGLPDWFQLVGLLHDMGKVMFAIGGVKEDGQHGTAESPQWGLGGDTWVVGCKIPDCAVFPEFNSLNPDYSHPVYGTEFGMYQPHCGLHNLQYAYGHDEYMYQMLIANKSTIPEAGLAMVRFHSLYPWHTGGAYRHLMNEGDYELLRWVQQFNKYDLYTKDERGLGTSTEEELWAYYEPIIAKYFPEEKMMW